MPTDPFPVPVHPSFPQYCGPTALASAMGTTREDAAREITRAVLARGGDAPTGACFISDIAAAIGARAHETRLASDERRARSWEFGSGRGGYQRLAVNFPTLARWLRENPDREAIVRASHHFVHVRNGTVVECNGWEPRRGRVTHAVFLD